MNFREIINSSFFLKYGSESNQDSTASEEEMFPEGQPQVAEETDTQSSQGPDPTSLHLTVNCEYLAGDAAEYNERFILSYIISTRWI